MPALRRLLNRWFPPRAAPPNNRSLLGEITATREQIADLKIVLRAFDERLQRFTETHPPKEGPSE